jgi:hypothetical protein
VPVTPFGLLMLIVVTDPLQMVWLAGVASTSGIGLMVISTVIGIPGQALAEGVIVYLTTAGVLVTLVRFCDMDTPLPLVKPEAVPDNWITVHAKVVPATLFGLVMLMVVVAPLQIVWLAGVARTFGIGFTVTSTVIGIPGQLFAEGVIVYLTTAGVLVAFDNVWVIPVPEPFEKPVGVPL